MYTLLDSGCSDDITGALEVLHGVEPLSVDHIEVHSNETVYSYVVETVTVILDHSDGETSTCVKTVYSSSELWKSSMTSCREVRDSRFVSRECKPAHEDRRDSFQLRSPCKAEDRGNELPKCNVPVMVYFEIGGMDIQDYMLLLQ